MPCYTGWDAYLEKGSKEYADKKAELQAKLQAVKHILDYYYGIEERRVPHATHSGERTWLEMAHQQFTSDVSDLQEAEEKEIIKKISHHCSCDGIHFTLLYDLVSLLDIKKPDDAGYARVMMACANELRANDRNYNPISC